MSVILNWDKPQDNMPEMDMLQLASVRVVKGVNYMPDKTEDLVPLHLAAVWRDRYTEAIADVIALRDNNELLRNLLRTAADGLDEDWMAREPDAVQRINAAIGREQR